MNKSGTNKQARVPVQVVLFDKEFLASCLPNEEAGLNQAVALLNSKINDIKKAGIIVGTDRIALMAALNITFELVTLRAAKNDSNGLTERLSSLCQRFDSALDDLTSV